MNSPRTDFCNWLYQTGFRRSEEPFSENENYAGPTGILTEPHPCAP